MRTFVIIRSNVCALSLMETPWVSVRASGSSWFPQLSPETALLAPERTLDPAEPAGRSDEAASGLGTDSRPPPPRAPVSVLRRRPSVRGGSDCDLREAESPTRRARSFSLRCREVRRWIIRLSTPCCQRSEMLDQERLTGGRFSPALKMKLTEGATFRRPAAFTDSHALFLNRLAAVFRRWSLRNKTAKHLKSAL